MPVELLESVVFEQKDGCTRESFRVHSNQPVLPQGFVLHSFRDQTSRRNLKDRLRTRACHSNNPCAEDRGSKSTRGQTRTSTMPPDNERQKCASCSLYKRQKLGAQVSYNFIFATSSALARPISGLTSSFRRSREIFRFHLPYRSPRCVLQKRPYRC